MIPEPFELLLMALAAGRVWKIIGDDRILDRPRDWLLEQVVVRRSEQSGVYWGDFLVCPWCAGFWVSLLVWASWLAWPDFTIGACVLFALSALVGLFGVAVDALQNVAK